jgi:hypothetical protein
MSQASNMYLTPFLHRFDDQLKQILHDSPKFWLRGSHTQDMWDDNHHLQPKEIKKATMITQIFIERQKEARFNIDDSHFLQSWWTSLFFNKFRSTLYVPPCLNPWRIRSIHQHNRQIYIKPNNAFHLLYTTRLTRILSLITQNLSCFQDLI